MAIYKLGEICEIKKGSDPISTAGHYKLVGSGGYLGFTRYYKTQEESILIPRVGTMKIYWIEKNVWNINTAFLIEKTKNSICNKKFLYYKLILMNWKVLIKGTTVPVITIKDWMNLSINLISLKDQQKIIDIIEPMENMINELEKTFLLLKTIEEKLLFNSSPIEKMNINCKFLKGIVLNNESVGKTIFLNVSAANKNINKYCDENPNTFIGDITLSLDGNTGLVNNCLEGFNGYLYNIKSDLYKKSQIYYSLLHKNNQGLIIINETGTTIKHSSNSKKELLIYKFKHDFLLENLFIFSIKIELLKNKIIKLKNEMIHLLIK